MNYKKLIILNIVSLFLLITSAISFYISNEHSESLAQQSIRIEQVKSLVRATCDDAEIKQQLLKVLASTYEAQKSTYKIFHTFAEFLLVIGVINVVFSILVVRKCKV